jgi:precorrin-2 dehydrogenase / sirohydrochlorin ferrochelatase
VAEAGETVYPVALRLTGKPVLVVGGGDVAARKVSGLVAAGAVVTVVAPQVAEAIASSDRCRVERRAYRRGEAAGYRLVIAATDDSEVNQAVHDDAEAAGVWVNVADEPPRCSFFLPAVARDGPVVVAVSTGGASPALAGWLRDRLALPEGVGAVAAQLAAERAAAMAAGASTESIDWRTRIEVLLQRSARDT